MMLGATSLIRKALQELSEEGLLIHSEYLAIEKERQRERDEKKKKPIGIQELRFKYQQWYTKALKVIQQLMPERLKEFENLYISHNRKELDAVNYTISDFLNGLLVPYNMGRELEYFLDLFSMQLSILASAFSRIDSILADTKGVLRADLLDNELAKAKELLKNEYIRPAGVICGVILEEHLAAVCDNHHIRITKSKPTLVDYNDNLKNSGVYDVSQWRQIQYLGDVRNKCAHNGIEPNESEVLDLISGVEKVVKMIH